MANDLSSRRALVTGSTTGIGRGIAHALASKGSSVVLTGIATDTEVEDLLKEFRSSYSGKFDFVAGNFMDPYKTEQFGKDVLALYPQGVDILVNCAAIPERASIEELTLPQWLNAMSVNLTAPFVLTKAFFALMKERRWGRIIHVGTVNSIISDPGKAAYSSSKSGLLGLTRVTALEGAEFGVTCNVVCPCIVDSPMGLGVINDIAKTKGVPLDQAKEYYLQNVSPPTKKIVRVSEVAEMVAFLCSEHACSITGSPIRIDGAHTAR